MPDRCLQREHSLAEESIKTDPPLFFVHCFFLPYPESNDNLLAMLAKQHENDKLNWVRVTPWPCKISLTTSKLPSYYITKKKGF